MDRTKALKAIRTAWIAGVISAVLTLVIALADSRGAVRTFGLVDATIIAALTAGVAAKSRVCAVLLLFYFALSKVLMMTSGVRGGYVTMLLFVWYYWQGVRGTLAWHAAGAYGAAPERIAAASPGTADGPRFRTREEYEAWKASRIGPR